MCVIVIIANSSISCANFYWRHYQFFIGRLNTQINNKQNNNDRSIVLQCACESHRIDKWHGQQSYLRACWLTKRKLEYLHIFISVFFFLHSTISLLFRYSVFSIFNSCNSCTPQTKVRERTPKCFFLQFIANNPELKPHNSDSCCFREIIIGMMIIRELEKKNSDEEWNNW